MGNLLRLTEVFQFAKNLNLQQAADPAQTHDPDPCFGGGGRNRNSGPFASSESVRRAGQVSRSGPCDDERRHVQAAKRVRRAAPATVATVPTLGEKKTDSSWLDGLESQPGLR